MSPSPLLDVSGLAIELHGRMPVTEATFSLSEGSCIGLVGETGCGKTMTCRALTGMLSRIGAVACAGRVLLGDVDLLGLSERGWGEIRGRQVALVPQGSLSGLNPVRRVGKQLREAVATLDPGSDARSRSLELLTQVHMPNPEGVLGLYPHELSGGMRQRVMIALGLAGRPKLLVADEPTTAVDVTVQRGILELLQELRDTTGMAQVLVTHDLGVVQSIANLVAVMYAGAVVESGQAADVLTTPRHPYTRALLEARLMGEPGALIVTIPGNAPGLDDRPSGCPFNPRCPIAVKKCLRETPHLEELGAMHLAACWRAAEEDRDEGRVMRQVR